MMFLEQCCASTTPVHWALHLYATLVISVAPFPLFVCVGLHRCGVNEGSGTRVEVKVN